MTAIDLSSDAGLIAMVLLTVNILLGHLVSTRYNTVLRWPHRELRLGDIHNWTGYTGLGLVALHPIFLLFPSTAHFRVIDVLWPLHSPGQVLYNCLGAIAFYGVVFVVVTSYFRDRLSKQLWKNFHYVAYAATVFLFVHSLLADPNLKSLPPDLLDGEKVLIEVCFLLSTAGTVWRVRFARKKKQEAARLVEVA